MQPILFVMEHEEWRTIPLGAKFIYEGSNLGRIRRITKTHKPRVRYPTFRKTTKGYLAVQIKMNGIDKRIVVHRLIATIFIDNPHNKPDVNHKDLDKTNNRADNLEWATKKENMEHYVASQTYRKPRVVLSKDKKAEIKSQSPGISKMRLCKLHGITLKTLNYVLRS